MIDQFLDRTWSQDYTCNDFLIEVWLAMFGEDLSERLKNDEFKRLNEPISPCIAFYTNGSKSSTHVGLFFDNKIVHLTGRGVQIVEPEIVAMNFRETRFYI